MHKKLAVLFLFALISMPFLGMLYSPSIPFKPNFPGIQSFSARQQAFVIFMIPKINYSNAEILTTRAQIKNLASLFQETGSLTYTDHSWLNEIADVYQVSHFNIANPESLTELLNRVDEVPSSLVLAQAANESGWGTSRFAVQADNFFGQHCNVPGCGIIPLGRTDGEGFEVQSFPTVQSSIDNYLYNLNTNPSYANFRAMRAELRAQNEPLVGFRLAPFLTNYSILGGQYSVIISSIIINHNLMQYDALQNSASN